MDWEKYGVVIRSKNKKAIIWTLNRPKTPSEIAKETNLAVSTVSKGLAKLSEIGMIKCLNPKLMMGKFYGLTKEGKEIMKRMKLVK